MITAEEAYKESMKVREQRLNKELEEVEIVINRHKALGNLSCTIENYISDELKKKLEESHYKVKFESDRNESYTTIDWNMGIF
jgi:hypothetical protein